MVNGGTPAVKQNDIDEILILKLVRSYKDEYFGKAQPCRLRHYYKALKT